MLSRRLEGQKPVSIQFQKVLTLIRRILALFRKNAENGAMQWTFEAKWHATLVTKRRDKKKYIRPTV